MEEKAKQTILLHVHFLDFLDFILFFSQNQCYVNNAAYNM